MEDQEERVSGEPKDTEASVGSETLELVEREEEVLPEELPKWAGVDHSKLYIWVADAGNDRIQKFDGNEIGRASCRERV